MSTYTLDQTWNGMTNQPPWRTQPGQVQDILNLRLDIAKGATSRNGTDLIRYLEELDASLNINDVLFASFRGDILAIHAGGIVAFDGETGNPRLVSDSTGGFPYLAGASKQDLRFTIVRDSLLVLNRTAIAATETSPDYSINGTVSRYTDLIEIEPPPSVNSIYRVKFNDGAVPSGYFKRVDLGSGQFDWQRIAAPSQPNAVIAAATMPHQLVRNTDGTYSWSTIAWTHRRSGNDESNPRMPWFGSPLLDLSFHNGRLFLLAAGIISASSSRDLTLLFLNDIDNVEESDYISHDIANAQAGKALYSASVGHDLFIACENGVLSYTSGQEQLTNVNGTDLQLSDIQAIPDFAPSSTGGSIVLMDTTREIHSFDYDPTAYSLRYGGTLNAHALKVLRGVSGNAGSPEVEPWGLFRIGSTTYIPTNGWTRVHELTVERGNLLQTGWTKFHWDWQYNADNYPFYFDNWDGALRIVIKTAHGFALLRYIPKEETNPATFFYTPALDFRQSMTGTYNQSVDRTRFNYVHSTQRTRVCTPGIQSQELIPTVRTDLYVEVPGRVTGACIIGNMYYDYLEMTGFYAGATNVKPTLSTLTVFYDRTMSFDILIRRRGAGGSESQREYKYKATNVAADLIIDSCIVTGSKAFLVLQDGRNTRIRIEHQSAVPMTLSALAFELRFTDNRSTR